MTLAITLTTLITFATSPDLCAEVYLDSDGVPLQDSVGQTLARFCKWTGPDAPLLEADVCCNFDNDYASCWLPSNKDKCPTRSQRYCKHGEILSGQGVVCYQSFPSTCDLGHCVDGPDLPPDVQEDLLCCSPGACQEIAPALIWDCEGNGGTISWCADGMSNLDGSITCFD